MPAVWLGGMPHSSFLEVCPPPYLFLPVGLSEEAERKPRQVSAVAPEPAVEVAAAAGSLPFLPG